MKLVPNSRLVLFEGGSHLLFIENAEDFNRVVLDFLREVDGQVFNANPRKLVLNV